MDLKIYSGFIYEPEKPLEESLEHKKEFVGVWNMWFFPAKEESGDS